MKEKKVIQKVFCPHCHKQIKTYKPVHLTDKENPDKTICGYNVTWHILNTSPDRTETTCKNCISRIGEVKKQIRINGDPRLYRNLT